MVTEGTIKAPWHLWLVGAMLASVLILVRNKLASAVFAMSLTAFLISLIYTCVLTDGGEIMGGRMAIIVDITMLLLFFSLGREARAPAP